MVVRREDEYRAGEMGCNGNMRDVQMKAPQTAVDHLQL
jgi:hypothetical protein